MTRAALRSRLPDSLVLLAAAVAYLPRVNWVLPLEDATVIGAWGMQVAAGQMPYRDFFVFTTPGTVLLYGGVFRLAGSGIVVERVVTGVAVLVAVWATFAIARRLLPTGWAAGVAIFWGAWLGVFYQYGPHHYWSAALLLLSALWLCERRFLAAGAAAGLAVVFMQATAIAVFVFCAVAVLHERNLRRSLLPMSLAGVAVALPFALWIVLEGGLQQFFTDAVVFNLHYYPRANSFPFPWLPFQLKDAYIIGSGFEALWLIFFGWPLLVALPLVLVFSAGVGLWRWRGQGQLPPRLLVTMLSCALFAAAVPVRPTAPLAWFAAPLAFVVAAAALRDVVSGRRMATATLIAFGVSGLVPFPAALAVSCDINPRAWATVSAAGGTLCAPRQFAPQMRAAYAFSSAHRGMRIAYLPAATSYYQLTGEAPPVPMVWVIPSLTMPGQLESLERSLVTGDVEYVFYFEMPDAPPSPHGQADFDALLARHYRPVATGEPGSLPAWRLEPPGPSL